MYNPDEALRESGEIIHFCWGSCLKGFTFRWGGEFHFLECSVCY